MARVLIVDDNLLIRTLLREILEHGGHQVAAEATDGLEITSLVRELKPDLAILDLVMPRRDGLAALEDLTHRAPTVPVLICSASLTAPKVIRAIQLGARGFITKPFDRKSVLDALQAVADDRLVSLPPISPSVRGATALAPGTDERRNFPRVPIALGVTLTPPSGHSIKARTVNVGGGGMLLATEPLPPDTVVDFCLDLGPNWLPITGRARVVRGTATTQQAVAFEEISIIAHEQLIHFLAETERSVGGNAAASGNSAAELTRTHRDRLLSSG